MSELDSRLKQVAAAGTLLVASDFDGTLSPIVNDPALAAPLERATDALAGLADLPATHAAVVSGRALDDLRARARVPDHVHLIGGHGTEIASLPDLSLTPAQRALRSSVLESLDAIARAAPGFTVEAKPASVAFHYRNADPSAAAAALDRVRTIAARPGVFVREGKKVIELGVSEGDKGRAIRLLADSLDVDTIVYIGDDVTDEDAFAVMDAADLGIKVGAGPTRAAHRVEDPEAVTGVLTTLLRYRSARSG